MDVQKQITFCMCAPIETVILTYGLHFSISQICGLLTFFLCINVATELFGVSVLYLCDFGQSHNICVSVSFVKMRILIIIPILCG